MMGKTANALTRTKAGAPSSASSHCILHYTPPYVSTCIKQNQHLPFLLTMMKPVPLSQPCVLLSCTSPIHLSRCTAPFSTCAWPWQADLHGSRWQGSQRGPEVGYRKKRRWGVYSPGSSSWALYGLVSLLPVGSSFSLPSLPCSTTRNPASIHHLWWDCKELLILVVGLCVIPATSYKWPLFKTLLKLPTWNMLSLSFQALDQWTRTGPTQCLGMDGPQAWMALGRAGATSVLFTAILQGWEASQAPSRHLLNICWISEW